MWPAIDRPMTPVPMKPTRVWPGCTRENATDLSPCCCPRATACILTAVRSPGQHVTDMSHAVPRLRAPIVLVHGLFGFDVFRAFDIELLPYFRGIRGFLRRAG